MSNIPRFIPEGWYDEELLSSEATQSQMIDKINALVSLVNELAREQIGVSNIDQTRKQ